MKPITTREIINAYNNPVLVKNINLDQEWIHYSEFKKALNFLFEGKRKFAPTTTNSDVDEFLRKHGIGEK